MRAKAWILTLFIGMIRLVGFGHNTADLIPNSKADSVVCVDIAIELASVEVQLINNVFVENSVVESNTYFDAGLVIVQELFYNAFFEAKKIRPGLDYKQAGEIKNNHYTFKETKFKPDRTIEAENSNQVAYRRARDSLRQENYNSI